jgi:hypothetical protein
VSAGYVAAIGRVAWLAAVAVAFERFGDVLPSPPIDSVPALEAWFADAGGEVALLTVVRLGAILVASPILALAVVRLAELAVVDTTRMCLDRTAPGALLGLARGVASLSLTVGLTSVPPVSKSPTEGAPGVTTSGADAPPASGTATMRRVVDEPTPTTPGAAAVPSAGVPSTPPSGPRVADSVVVAPGDSFWSIAEDVVIDRGGPTDEGSVARYWRELIAVNLHGLVDPRNPDLIHPGQRLTLPPG